MPRLIAAVPLPTMRASRPGECAGKAWRDYSGRAAVRRSKRCDLVTPKAKRKRWQESRDLQLTMSKGRAGGPTTRCSTLLGCPQRSVRIFCEVAPQLFGACRGKSRHPTNGTARKPAGRRPLPFVSHSSQAERETPHPPPNVRAFITACREGDFRGAACPTAART
jgi:hypothetical protein